ncbi:unnamed protein product [Cuscuta campestris]|uniref:Uncharacterized protein n=1 Tax=Cuscuta campestris TaxID=132261 RepID=A0A484LVB0_9ASTE|nr:unnamed protein product [Cuscuta campestris]
MSVPKFLHFTHPSHKALFGRDVKENKRNSNSRVSNNDPSSGENKPTTDSSSSSPAKPSFKKSSPLTVRDKLRAARVLNRYNEPNTALDKPVMGNKLFDVLREAEKGKKRGLPEAPNNLFDDETRGLPKPGLTFDLPGGFDLFLIAFSFVFISTVMFGTTYIVWKVGAIHFNEY